jgi:hypothetical protein
MQVLLPLLLALQMQMQHLLASLKGWCRGLLAQQQAAKPAQRLQCSGPLLQLLSRQALPASSSSRQTLAVACHQAQLVAGAVWRLSALPTAHALHPALLLLLLHTRWCWEQQLLMLVSSHRNALERCMAAANAASMQQVRALQSHQQRLQRQ